MFSHVEGEGPPNGLGATHPTPPQWHAAPPHMAGVALYQETDGSQGWPWQCLTSSTAMAPEAEPKKHHATANGMTQWPEKVPGNHAIHCYTGSRLYHACSTVVSGISHGFPRGFPRGFPSLAEASFSCEAFSFAPAVMSKSSVSSVS